MKTDTNTSKRKIAKIASGILLISAGALMLSRNLGMEIPYWLTSWPVLIIALGFIAGIKHQFRKPGAYIMVLIGSVFLLKEMVPGYQVHEIAFPLAITSLGIFVILKRNDHPFAQKSKDWHDYKHCK